MEEKVRKLIEDEVNKMGIKIDSIIYEKEGSNYFLRIVIDRDEAIDIDTCVEVTNIINPLLDKADFINDSYILDVSTKEKGEESE
jgi:ribosome maturation factor RimP